MNLKPQQTPDQTEIERLKTLLWEVGICPNCGQEIIHDMYEPLASCSCCVIMEWTGNPPQLSLLRHELATSRRQFDRLYSGSVWSVALMVLCATLIALLGLSMMAERMRW